MNAQKHIADLFELATEGAPGRINVATEGACFTLRVTLGQRAAMPQVEAA